VLVLLQTKKVQHCPVILYDSRYWAGLINWIRETMLTSEKISAADVGLLRLSDDPQEICELVSAAYQEDSRSQREPGSTTIRGLTKGRQAATVYKNGRSIIGRSLSGL